MTLLREYAGSGSEAAFAALVERYVNLVYSTALRSVGNAHAAEEITQAVFIILAKKAGELSKRAVLSGWLYQTARLTATNFLRGEIRRQQREQEAYMQSAFERTGPGSLAANRADAGRGDGPAWRKDRNAIVLRFFENKNFGEVGAALGRERRRGENAREPRAGEAAEIFHRTRRGFDARPSSPERFPRIPFKPRRWRWQNP